MTEYFNMVISDLTLDDLGILGILLDNEATSNFKALKYKSISGISELSKAKFYKTIYRLSANKFIEIIAGKEYRMYITSYGITALEKSLSNEGVKS